MIRKLTAAMCALCASVSGAVHANIDIVFDYSYDAGNFFDAPRRALLDHVAGSFESRLTDSLGAITSSGPNQFDVVFDDPSSYFVDAQNQIQASTVSLNGYSVAANQLVIYVGASNLAGGPLGIGGPGGFAAGGTQAFIDSLSRGQAGASGAAASQTDFAPWGGQITFNTAVNWYFDADPASDETFAGFDFLSVALHETAHVLGIGTANSWLNLATPAGFQGAAAIALQGGAPALEGDGAHWLAGSTSTIAGAGSFEAAMDPDIAPGLRKRLTDLDFAGLDDLGWQVAPVAAVPEPSTYVTLLLGLATLWPALRRRRRAL